MPGTTSSQQPPELPRTTASAELTIFNLDVVVTDSKGNPIHGLTADDFEVLHDRKPVRVTNFREEGGSRPAEAREAQRDSSAVPVAAPAPGTAEALAQIRPVRHLVLFFDRLDLPDPAERKEFFGAMKGLVRKALGPGDDAMVVTWDGSIRSVTPFSSDLAVLENAVDGAARRAVRRGTESWELERIFDDVEATMGAGLIPEVTMDLHLLETRAYQEAKAKAAAMRGVIAALAGMDGRKILVLCTRRFPRYAGSEFGGHGIDTKALRDSVINAANAGGVTLYPIDSRETEPGLPTAASPQRIDRIEPDQRILQDQMANLAVMAEKTGGIVAKIKEADSFGDRISRDLNSWYSLGYPAPAGASRSAAVSVRARNNQLLVRVRQSLVEKTPEEQMSERVLSHLFRQDPHAKIPITATAKAGPRVKGAFRVQVELKVPIGSLTLLPTAGGVKGAFSVFAAAVGPGGSFSEVGRQRRPFEIPRADIEKAKASHFTYEFAIDSSGPASRICVGVWDEAGQIAGFAIVSPTDS